MEFDYLSLLKDYEIDHTTEHHHCTEGWVNVHCPFCHGKRNYHLGIHLETGVCNCWRCGSHSLFMVLSRLLSVSTAKVGKILATYAVEGVRVRRGRTKFKSGKTELVLPKLISLTPRHEEYLKSRNFDVDELVQLWDLKSIGPTGPYKHRIFIPIKYEHKTVSFQGRAVNPSVSPRYKTCAKKDEVHHHKYLLYGLDYVLTKKTILVVEGVTDVWRIGPGAVATFGITYTLSQVLLLAQFDNVYIMYDNEKQAQKQAEKLGMEVSLLTGNEVKIISHYNSSDPGSLNRKEVERILSLIQ